MAVRGKYYQLEFKNADKNLFNAATPQTIYIRIYDLTLEDDTTTEWEVIDMLGAGEPLRLSTVDNSEDKFTGLKPIQATITFLSSNSVKLSTFVNAPIPTGGVDVGDPRWYVEIYYNTYDPLNLIFKGFLNIDDCYEPFLPEKNEVVLVANDGLGGLKNIPLTDFNGDNPTGYNRIADYLAWALSKTGLDLPLKAVFNIREYTQSTSHFFDAIYLHAKTFEDKIGTCINCYDALERILGEMAFLTQRNGEWWIVRIDELAGTNPLYVATFNADGAFDSIDSGHHYPKFIGSTESVFFSNEETTVHPLRPHQSIKESFKFEFPEEVVDNIDFSKGDFINFNSGTLVAKYEIEDWEALEGSGGVPGLGSPSTTQNYIKRVFLDTNMTYESERYVVIEGTGSGGTFFIKSNPIPVHQNDKIDVSVDARFSVDVFPSSGFVRFNTIQVRLTADDGTYYTLHGGTSVDKTLEWRITSASFASNNRFFVIEGDSSEDLTKWKTATWFTDSVEQFPCPPIPKDGYLEILLIWDQNSSFNTDRYFSNLRFTYIPYINGSYSKYSTYYYKISQDIKQVKSRDRQVYISDSPKKLFKGALFKKVGSAYILTNQFYAWNDIHTTSPDFEFVHPYGHIQAYDVWNQHRNGFIKFQGTMQGLDGANTDDNGYINPPHLIHFYTLLDSNEHTDNRQFVLLTFDQSFYSCEWKGTLIENYNSVNGKSYLDTLETKYEQ